MIKELIRKRNNKLVAKIHKEVDEAQDLLLKEADEIIKSFGLNPKSISVKDLYNLMSNYDKNYYGNDIRHQLNTLVRGHKDYNSFPGSFDIESTTRIQKDSLFIAAPKSHFDLKDLKNHKLGFFKSITIVEPKDPIVFRYVNGGLQILSVWGIEASDKDLVNEINN